MSKRTTLVILGLLVLTCLSSYSQNSTADVSINISKFDKDMNAIIDESRKTIDVFITRWQSPDSDEKGFMIKYPFDTDPGSPVEKEHIWINNIELINGKYYGIIGNDSDYIKKIKYGMKVEFDIRIITDWMYMKKDKIVGGKSIKLLLLRIPENERDESSKTLLQMFE